MIECVEDIDYSVIDALLRSLKPDPIITLSEWADSKRVLPPTAAEPGPFRTSRTPYVKEISDKLSVKDPAQKIIWMKSSQVAATEMANNWVGYSIDADPCVFLYIMPTDAMMKSTSKNRIQKMIDSTDCLGKKIKGNRAKDSGNTILEKEFEGGLIKMVGANSPVGLASIAAKKVYGDEVDRFPEDVGGEGDAISLAETRTATFGERRKILLTSTPTIKGKSIIAKEFEKTGQRHWHVPCPYCGCTQKLIHDNLIWVTGKYDSVKYQCAHCNEMIEERHKTKMLDNGDWIPDFPEREDGFTFGYHINALYSPLGWYSWARYAKDYDEALDDLLKMIVFVNTKKGECYEAEADAPQWEALYNKRVDYKLNMPNEKVIFITAGVDIQKDRIEVEIVGWGKGKQSWSIDYRVLLGNTDSASNPVWAELDKIVNETWAREDGAVLPLQKMAVDSGNNTTVVYEWCGKYSASKVIPIKGGKDTMSVMVAAPRAVYTTRAGKKIEGSVKVWMVGVSLIKTELYGWLQLQHIDGEDYQHGYCHFPMYDENHFRSLTSEKLQFTTNKKGFPVQAWVRHFKRNERLDCRVYARAAAFVLGIDRITDSDWDRLHNETKDLIPVEKPVEEQRKVRKSTGYWKD